MDDAVAAVIARMEDGLARMKPEDARRHFHGTYLRTTRAVAEEIDRGGFLDAAWLNRWDVAFADLYLDALDAEIAGGPVPGRGGSRSTPPGTGPTCRRCGTSCSA
ncbi:hypothetical protein GCM10027610_010600 [Dactylosporangium cerinum]